MLQPNPPNVFPIRRRGCGRYAAGCGIAFIVAIIAAIVLIGAWMVPNARVSTLPAPPPEPTPEQPAPAPAPPPPALLVHVDTTAPEITTLIEESMGPEAMLVTGLMPYEGTLTVAPDPSASLAHAEIKLNVPRSAAAMQVFLRAYIDQPAPSGYVVREVERPETAIIRVLLEGPLGTPQAGRAEPLPPESLTLDITEPSLAIALHNENGAWGRVVAGYIQAQQDLIIEPLFDWNDIVAASLAAKITSVDELTVHGIIRCLTEEAAAQFTEWIRQTIDEAQAVEGVPLRYQLDIAATGPTIHGNLDIQGLRETAQVIAQNYKVEN